MQGLVTGLLSDSGVNNVGSSLCVCERERERPRGRESTAKCWVGVGLDIYVSGWLRASSAVSMACSTTASLHAAHRCRSAN